MIRYRLLVILILLSLSIVSCSGSKSGQSSAKDLGVSENNELLRYFKKKHKGREVIKCGSSDLNNDDTDDLVVIYNVGKEKNEMKVVLDLKGKYSCTNQVPAPVSNQEITFKNIDDKPPMEFIVQGSRGSKIGYAIFRVKGTKLYDLFGEGMEDCC